MSDDRFYKIIWKNILEIRKKNLRQMTAKDVLWIIVLELLFFTIIISPTIAECIPTLFSSIRRFLGKARYLLFKKIIDLEDSLKSQKHKNYILTNENFGLTSENHKLTDRNCELTNINRTLIDEKNQVTEKNSALTEEKCKLTKKNCELTNEKYESNNRKLELHIEKLELACKNLILTNELTNKDQELMRIKILLLEAEGKINNPSESNIMGREEALGILRIDDPNPSQAEISSAYRKAVDRFHPDSAPVEQSMKEKLLSKNLRYLYETVQEASKGEDTYIDKLFKSTAEKIVFEATQARDFLTDYENKVRQMDRERGEHNKEGLSK